VPRGHRLTFPITKSCILYHVLLSSQTTYCISNFICKTHLETIDFLDFRIQSKKIGGWENKFPKEIARFGPKYIKRVNTNTT